MQKVSPEHHVQKIAKVLISHLILALDLVSSQVSTLVLFVIFIIHGDEFFSQFQICIHTMLVLFLQLPELQFDSILKSS